MTADTAKQAKTGHGPHVAPHDAIIAHRLFPVALAGWFAALFALSMLAIRASVVEAAVIANGLDAVLPASGIYTKLILASVLGVIGAGLGYALGRLLQIHYASRAHSRAAQGAQTAAKARQASDAARQRRRPIRAHEELGTAGFDGDLNAAGVDGAAPPSPAPLRPAPLRPAQPSPAQPPVAAAAAIAEAAPVAEPQIPENLPPQNLANAAAQAVQSHGQAAARIAATSLEEMSQCALIERLAIAIQRRQAQDAARAAQDAAGLEAHAAPHNAMAASRSAQLGAILAGLNGCALLSSPTGANDSAEPQGQTGAPSDGEWHPNRIAPHDQMAVNGAHGAETVASLRAALAALRDVKQAPGN